MNKPTMTYEHAVHLAQQAGTRSMRAGHREMWNQADYEAACAEFARVWPGETAAPPGADAPRCARCHAAAAWGVQLAPALWLCQACLNPGDLKEETP
jgi:hypothetical protein